MHSTLKQGSDSMRSTFTGLNTMVRGIFSNQLSLDTTGHNITNASTEGYSRQSVNLAATRCQMQGSLYGDVAVGTGVDSVSITRARNIFADIQFRNETSTEKYYEVLQTNYDKIEAVFDDSDEIGIQSAIQNFWKSWVDLEGNASTSSNRVTVIEQGKILSDVLQSATLELRDQISSAYEDLRIRVDQLNDITSQIVLLNRQITAQEVTGAMANDLRDQRDLLVDQLSEYVDITVSENSIGAYSIISNGVTLVNNVSKLDLKFSEGASSSQYGVMESSIYVGATGMMFNPNNGTLRADLDTIAENKSFIDDIANMSAFMLDTLNRQHRAGYDLNNNEGQNFYGSTDIIYQYAYDESRKSGYLQMTNSAGENVDSSGNVVVEDDIREENPGISDNELAIKVAEASRLYGIQVIEALEVNGMYSESDGDSHIAARLYKDTDYDREQGDTAGFRNATLIGALFNMTQSYMEENSVDDEGNYVLKNDDGSSPLRAIGVISLNNYYIASMSRLGVDAESVDVKIETQQGVLTQINNWRASEMGVDWNEELTNMIKFQKGYSACARMLTTMDEMLDRLVNNTGMVGR